jgi:hypothetical protein
MPACSFVRLTAQLSERSRPFSVSPAICVHQSHNFLPYLKQFLARFGHQRLRQQLLRRDCFQPGLRLMQVIQSPLKISHGEGRVAHAEAPRNAVQRPRQLRA